MEDEIFFAQLRDCFYAGYTMPQFCIDNEIKNPLFVVSASNHWSRLWEIYIQFKYDKRLQPKFTSLDCEVYRGVNSSLEIFTGNMIIEKFSDINLNAFDKIIDLGNSKSNLQSEKIIYLDQLVKYFIWHVYSEIPILKFAQNFPKAKFILTNTPRLKEAENNSEFEKELLRTNYSAPMLREYLRTNRTESLVTPYDFLGYNKQELFELLATPVAHTEIDGSTFLEDSNAPMVQIREGHRYTPNQPKNFKNTIYFFGYCIHYGFGVPFDKTVESCLQKLLNENNFPYKVENRSQTFFSRVQDLFYNLNKINPANGDIFFINVEDSTPVEGFKNNVRFFNVRDIFTRPHNYGEVFADSGHINELGHKALADKFFDFLTQNNFFQNIEFNYPMPPPLVHRFGIPQENFSTTNFLQNKELEEYKQKLRAKKIPVGAIVMNCNPFTLGHEYLVEYAAARVGKLYIFVVEEDRSEFKFADRFAMVLEGVEKFSNVEVLPSGKFIISQKTFSGYFNKENLQDVSVDSSEDVEIFGREIAPTLGITVRFVGEEPEDTVTKSYNENMKKILPKYGVEVCEIPRKKIFDEVISAKKVRELLKAGDFDKLKNLVPKTTLKFFQQNFWR